MAALQELLDLVKRTKRTGGRVLPGNAPVDVPGIGMVEFGMNDELARISEELAARQGERLPTEYAPLNTDLGKRLAEEFALVPVKGDRESKRAYKELAKEISDQYGRARDAGYRHEFFPTVDGEIRDPYGNPRNAIFDINENRRLYTYPTSSGFGSDAAVNVDENPLLAPSQFLTSDGKPMTLNDEFRFIHDLYGHAAPGAGFRAGGEENAFLWHAPTMSPLARRAATTELRGQNSMVNYGPNAAYNRTASSENTRYADQKFGLLPRWASEVGRPSDRLDEYMRRLNEGRTGYEGAVDPSTGNVKLYHWAHEDLSRVDPSKQLTGLDARNKAIRNRASDPDYPERSYFGLLNVANEYKPESGLGNRRHVSEIHGSQLYNMSADPKGFRARAKGYSPQERATNLERMIADANYSGYVADDPSLGKVAAVFDPLKTQRGAVDPRLLGLLGAGAAGLAAVAPSAKGMGLDVSAPKEKKGKPSEKIDLGRGSEEKAVRDFRYPVKNKRAAKVAKALLDAADQSAGIDIATPARPWGELIDKYARGEPRTFGDYFFANPLLYAIPAAGKTAQAVRASRAGSIASGAMGGLLGLGVGARLAEGGM